MEFLLGILIIGSLIWRLAQRLLALIGSTGQRVSCYPLIR